jgi:hypothetical protein
MSTVSVYCQAIFVVGWRKVVPSGGAFKRTKL